MKLYNKLTVLFFLMIAFKTTTAQTISLNSQFGQYCPSDTIAVNFNYDGYTVGNLVIFNGELSSTAGTFGSPTATNTISVTIPTGGSGDTIVILTIPASPGFSSGYKVRVRTVSPNTNIVSNAFTINNPTVDAGSAQTICSNSNASLDATLGGGAITATWSGGGTFSPNANTIDPTWTPSAAQITAGTATLTITTSGICPSVNDNVIITINAAATVDAGTPQTICSNSPLQLNGTIGGGAVSGTWSGGGTFSPNANTIDPTWTPSAAQITAGTATLTLTTNDPSGPCLSDNDNVVITINAAAIVSAGVDQSECAGTAISMNGNFGGGASAAVWASSGTGSFNNTSLMNAVYTPSPADIVAGTVTITLTTNDPSGPCLSVSDQMIITITPGATANAGVNQTICAGLTATMSGSFGGSAASASWSSGGSGSFNNASLMTAIYTPSAADISAGSVTITLTTNNPAGPCNAGTDQMVLTINPVATANAGIDQSICSGTTATMSGSIGGGASSGTWTTSGTGTFNNASSMSAVYTPSAADIAAGTVTITLTTNDPAGPCVAVNNQMILTISQAATVSAGVDQTICSGTTATMNGSFGGSATSATWSSSGSGSFSNISLMNAVYTPSAADINNGTVTITLTTNNPPTVCNAVTDQMILTINPVATANAGVDQSICAGTTATMSGSVGGGASSGIWTTSGNGTFNNASSMSAVYTPSAADIAAGTVTITLTTNDPAGPCVAVNNQMILTISQAATVSAGVDQTICSGTTATMNGSFGGSATSATWSSSGSGSFSNISLMNAVYTPSAADINNGTVTITLTTNNPPTVCNAVTDQMILTINPAAVANAGTDQTICAGTTATLNGSVSGGASSGTWSSAGTGTFNNASSMNAVYTPGAADISAGSVTITLTTNNPNGPCNAVSDIVIITINVAATVNAGVDETICADGTMNLNGLIGGSALTGTWSTTGNGSFDNNTSMFAVYTPGSIEIASGTVTLTLTTDNPTGPCNAVTDQVIITILPLPVISITPISIEICSGDTTTLHVNSTGTTQATSFNWQPTGLLNVSSGVDVIASVTNSSTSPILQIFSVIGSSSLGCTAFADVTITINPLPSIPVINGKNSICAGEANVIYTIAPPLTATDIFSWSATPAGINAFISNGNHDTCLADFSGLSSSVTTCTLFTTVTTTAFGCKSFGQKNISISGQAPPLEPVIEFSTNPFTLAVLYSQSGTNYRWGRDFIANFNQDTVGFNNEFGNQNLQLFLVPDTNATPLHFDQFYYWVEYYNDDINCKQKAYYNIDSSSMFQSLSGIQNKMVDAKNYFFIYPNPTDGIFTIQFNSEADNLKSQLFIYDLSGKEMENHFSIFNSTKLVINTERKYPPGIYFIKYINQNGGCQISKIIIQ